MFQVIAYLQNRTSFHHYHTITPFYVDYQILHFDRQLEGENI